VYIDSIHIESDRYARPFFEVFVLSLVAFWLPFKLIAYLIPFLGILWFALRANSGITLMRFASITCIFLTGVMGYFVFYYLIDIPFILQNTLLYFLTYGSFIFLLVIPRHATIHVLDYRKYIRVIRIFILFESLLGICQVIIFVALNGGNFDSATGDIAQGTLNPLSFLDSGANLNNQIYTNNLLTLLLFYMPHVIATRKGKWICVLGFLAILLASVWHLFIAFFLSTGIIVMFFSRSVTRVSGNRLLIASVAVLIIALTIALQPKNFELVYYYYEKVTTFESPKSKVTEISVRDLPKEYPWVYVIGLGPGQYSSRAGLIGTGKYFGDFENPRKIPLLEKRSSEAFEKYTLPYWTDVAMNPGLYGNSTMARPFYSALSLIIEAGFIAFAFIVIAFIVYIGHLRKLYRKSLKEPSRMKAFYAVSCAIFITYLAIISFFENYLEIAQAVLLGLLLFKYFYNVLKYDASSPVKHSTELI
jgi:hypothetical protein